MSYEIRPARPGDEEALFALIHGLARYARLAYEVSGSAAALREHLFGARPHRRNGVGRALLAEVIRLAEARGAGRVEWNVLQWNENAIAFYRRLGAELLPDYRVCRLSFAAGGVSA